MVWGASPQAFDHVPLKQPERAAFHTGARSCSHNGTTGSESPLVGTLRFENLNDDILVRNLFRIGRHLLRESHHRVLPMPSFLVWDVATAAS